jgi:hypothetical protein
MSLCTSYIGIPLRQDDGLVGRYLGHQKVLLLKGLGQLLRVRQETQRRPRASVVRLYLLHLRLQRSQRRQTRPDLDRRSGHFSGIYCFGID